MKNGFIQLHRQFLKWEWFDCPNMVNVFVYILLKANWKDKTWREIYIKRGSFITSIKTMSDELKISNQSIRTCLKRLEKTGEINKQSNKQYSIITVCKFDSYQIIENSITNNLTNEQQTNNKQLTTTNNYNNYNNINNIYKKFVDEVKNNAFQSRIEAIYMRLGIKHGSLTKLLENFRLHIVEENRLHKNTEEFFINFKNWLNTQDKIGKLNEFKK